MWLQRDNNVGGMTRKLPSEGGVGGKWSPCWIVPAFWETGSWLSSRAGHPPGRPPTSLLNLCEDSLLAELLCILTGLPPISPSFPVHLLPTPSSYSGGRTRARAMKALVSCHHGSRSAGCQVRGKGLRRCAQQALVTHSWNHWLEYLQLM